jgi:hypothetical protein
LNAMEGILGGSPFDEPVGILKNSDPATVAKTAGVDWEAKGTDKGFFTIPVLNETITVDFPGISVRAPGDLDTFSIKLLTLIYLSKSDGAPPSNTWTSYREFAGGRFYEPVFRRTVEDPVASTFGGSIEKFKRVSEMLGGKAEEFGDAAFSFRLFPRVLICFIVWKSDPEFHASANVLFDSNCCHHLSTFDLRMGAQEISSLLIKKGM